MWLKRNMLRRSGIEAPGCFNTGFAPTVVRCHYELLPAKDVYYVGCEVDIRDRSLRWKAYDRMKEGSYVLAGKYTVSGRKMYVYKSMTPARKRYERLCSEAIAQHNETLAEAQALREKANAGDLGAALTLGLDY